MKRIIGLISAAALLFAAASCQQEQLPAGNESGDVVTATFNVTIPDAMGTKAFGDASGINSFNYEVWEKNLETGDYDQRLLASTKEFDKTDADDNKSTELSLKLVRFKTYRVFFWAQGAKAKHTWTTDEGLQKVAIDYTPNIENDAFAGSTGDIDASYDFEIEDVTLVRPFAQINFATDDLGKDKGVTAGDLTLKSATVKVPGLATVYDAVNGCGITPENQTFESTALINETFTVGEAEYDGYVLMFYALIDGEATSTVADLEATFVATRNSEDVTVNWTGKSAMNNVAIQPNYRTNFYGSLFTANGSLNVSLDQEFANINDVDLDEAELNEIFADPTVTSYTLKSDVVIEEPLVFAVADRNFTLNLDGHTISNSKGIYNESQNQWSLISVQAGNVTIEGAGTVAALKDDCFAIDVRNGANLTIKDGTYVGNLSAVYVNSGSATIDGGTFSILQLNTGFDNVYCATLNCEDNAYNNGKAAITVNGGSFLGFEPGKSGLNGGKMSPEAKLGTNAPAVVYNEETNYYTVGEEETPAEPVDISAANIGAAATADGLYKVTGEITAAVPSDNSQSEDVTIDNVLTVTVPVPASSSTLAVKSSTETYYKVGGTITVTVEKKDGAVAETAEVTAYEAPEVTEPTGPEAITVAEFLELADATDAEHPYYQLTGTITGIVNASYGNFYLTDATGTVYVYGLTATQLDYGTTNDKSFASLGLQIGDVVTLCGTKTTYGTTIEVAGPAYYVSHTDAVSSEYGVVGTINNWGDNGTKDVVMYSIPGYYVAEGVELTKDDAIKIRKNNAWSENYGIADKKGAVTPSAGVAVVSGGNDIYVTAKGTYNVYLSEKLDAVYVLKSNSIPSFIAELSAPSMPEIPQVAATATEADLTNTTWSVIGSVKGNWDTDIDLALDSEGKYYTATNVALTTGDFKFRANKDWTHSFGATTSDCFAAIGTAYPAQYNGSNINILEAGNYNIYLAADFSTFKVEKYVDANDEVDGSFTLTVDDMIKQDNVGYVGLVNDLLGYKLGTAKVAQTLTVPANGYKTISFYAAGWTSGTNTIEVTNGTVNDSEIISLTNSSEVNGDNVKGDDFNITIEEPTLYILTVTDSAQDVVFSIKRGVIWGVTATK